MNYVAEVPARLYPLRNHPVQQKLARSNVRFPVVPAGRRSGKTELAKRKIIGAAMRGGPDSRFFAAAPTRDQAKRIYWSDLKAMVRPDLLMGRPSETELSFKLLHGPEIHVIGMDRPERMEGTPWDGGVLDEFGNMKETAWEANVRPALSDRRGWCWLIGVPEGRNHYYDLWKYALQGNDPEWAGFTWFSADILPPEEVESARRSLDPLVFQQEYEGSFVSFEGRAYYNFLESTHTAKLTYNNRAILAICFDFNVDPGVAAIIQEQVLPNQFERTADGALLLDRRAQPIPIVGTGIIGEVHIPRNSNTVAVCRRIIFDWAGHSGRVIVYGDSTGGARGTAQTEGSDWDIIRRELAKAFPQGIEYRVKTHNPAERARINAVNTRLRSADGAIHMMIDAGDAPNCVRDFDGVQLLKGGSGEIDKKIAPHLTHLSDAVGYYLEYEFPVSGVGMSKVTIGGH